MTSLKTILVLVPLLPLVAAAVAGLLRKPAPEQRLAMERCIERTIEARDELLAGDMARATMKVHAGPQRPKPPRPTPDEGGQP